MEQALHPQELCPIVARTMAEFGYPCLFYVAEDHGSSFRYHYSSTDEERFINTTISADAPPSGYMFKEWTGATSCITDVYSPSTTITPLTAGGAARALLDRSRTL